MPPIKPWKVFVTALLLYAFSAFPQESLQIIFSRFGVLRRYEFFPGDAFEYKLKGRSGFQKGTIAHLQDSLIVFDADNTIILSQIKCIRVKKGNYHARLFQSIFMIGAVGYSFLNAFNHAYNGDRPLPDEKALEISGSLLAASLILQLLQIKRIRITKNKTMKILDIKYNKLNQK